MFISQLINLRSLAARALPLCLTIGISVCVDHFVRSWLTSPVDRSSFTKSQAIKLDSPLIIKSIPDISFPESLRDLDHVDFWIISTAELDSDGRVKNIFVIRNSAVTFKERSFVGNVLIRVNEKQRRPITRELSETLVSQISLLQFEPAVNDGVTRSSHVVVSTHFHSYNDGAGNQWEIETQIDSEGDRLVSGHRIGGSFIDK